MHHAAAISLRRIIICRKTMTQYQVLMGWWCNARLSEMPAAPKKAERKPRRSAARTHASKENVVEEGSASPTRRRGGSPVRVLADSTKSRQNSISPEKVRHAGYQEGDPSMSWREEIGMVKQRIGLLQRKRESENCATSKPTCTMDGSEILPAIDVESMHRAGAQIAQRVLKQQVNFVTMRTFNEWGAFTRLQKIQKQRLPNTPRLGVSKADFDKMQEDNRQLLERLALTEQQRQAAEEINKSQRKANESLRRRVKGAATPGRLTTYA